MRSFAIHETRGLQLEVCPLKSLSVDTLKLEYFFFFIHNFSLSFFLFFF